MPNWTMRTLATSAGEYGNRISMATDRFMLQIKYKLGFVRCSVRARLWSPTNCASIFDFMCWFCACRSHSPISIAADSSLTPPLSHSGDRVFARDSRILIGEVWGVFIDWYQALGAYPQKCAGCAQASMFL